MSKKNSAVKLSIAETTAVHHWDEGNLWPLLQAAAKARETADRFLSVAIESSSTQAHGMAEHYLSHAEVVYDLLRLASHMLLEDDSWSLVHHAKTANLIPESLSSSSLVPVAGILRLSRSESDIEPIREKGAKPTRKCTTKGKTSNNDRKENLKAIYQNAIAKTRTLRRHTKS